MGILALTAASAGAQVVADTVSTGPSYANQVWYSLSADEQGNAAKNNWDLAFAAAGVGSGIMINSIIGTMLWNYPNGDVTAWATLDTAGLSTWTPRWNADTSWAKGAMGRYADPTNPNDLDWGVYNMTTHMVTGDSLYIIKLSDGSYKKLWIENLSSGTYNFKYANLDGSSLQTANLVKATYAGKNFGYYSLQHNTALDREPPASNWDLLFTQYTTFIPSSYTVTGVLANNGTEVARCGGLADKATFAAYSSASFSTSINTIGYNWKVFNGAGYNIQDSLVYFVKPANGDIWKVIFTGFSGGSTGGFMFTKEKLFTNTSWVAGATVKKASLALYPNPAYGGTIHLVYSIPEVVPGATIIISDMTGRVVLRERAEERKGLHQFLVPATQLLPGTYLVTLSAASYSISQKLTIQ